MAAGAIGSFLIGAGFTALGVVEEARQARYAGRAFRNTERRRFMLAQRAANQTADAAYDNLAARLEQEQIASAVNAQDLRREIRRRSATAATRAGESGVAGAVLADIDQVAALHEAEFETTRAMNLTFVTNQILSELEAVRNRQEQEIANALPGYSPGKPTAANTAFKAFSAIFGGYQSSFGTSNPFATSSIGGKGGGGGKE